MALLPLGNARMRYDLTDLKLFMAIAQAGNLSRASQARHLTPSAASQRLRNLEQALGCQLFTREHKGMRLTEEGHAMPLCSRVNRDRKSTRLNSSHQIISY